MYHKKRWRMPWRWIIVIVFVFIGAVGSAFTYAQIHNVQREIATTRRELNDQRLTNRNLESQRTSNYTREEIERMAFERLGMGEPDPSQIFYFVLPRQSGVFRSASEVHLPQENYFWQGVLSFFSGIRERIRN